MALQEVALTTVDGVVEDQAAMLARATGMEGRFGAVGHFPIVDPDTRSAIGAAFWGNAILSRLPIRSSHTVALPTAGDQDLVEPVESALELAGVRYADAPVGVRELRCLLHCELERDGEPLHAASTHLTHIGSSQRGSQAEALAATLGGLPGPLVLLGDLNAPIEAPELEPVSAHLVDAFAAVDIPAGDERRASCGPHRIDQVLVRRLDPVSCRVVVEASEASDHWPVAATFSD